MVGVVATVQGCRYHSHGGCRRAAATSSKVCMSGKSHTCNRYIPQRGLEHHGHDRPNLCAGHVLVMCSPRRDRILGVDRPVLLSLVPCLPLSQVRPALSRCCCQPASKPPSLYSPQVWRGALADHSQQLIAAAVPHQQLHRGTAGAANAPCSPAAAADGHHGPLVHGRVPQPLPCAACAQAALQQLPAAAQAGGPATRLGACRCCQHANSRQIRACQEEPDIGARAALLRHKSAPDR